MIEKVYAEIVMITDVVINVGLSVRENPPVRNKKTISWKDESNMSIALKNIDYLSKYNILRKADNYNFILLDGGLVQFQYSFDEDGVISGHRLAFFPSPNLEKYEDASEEYRTTYFGESEFHDLNESNIVSFPIRFDFSSNEKHFVPIYHPYCHLSLGEYKFCRIPVSNPLTPCEFMNFILKNFYSKAVKDFCGDLNFCSDFNFSNTISQEERTTLHLNIEYK